MESLRRRRTTTTTREKREEEEEEEDIDFTRLKQNEGKLVQSLGKLLWSSRFLSGRPAIS